MYHLDDSVYEISHRQSFHMRRGFNIALPKNDNQKMTVQACETALVA